MTFDNPFIDPLTIAGAGIRRMDAMFLASDGSAGGALGGVRPGDTGLVTSVVGTTITVTAGVAAVPYTGQGVYRSATASAWTGTVAAFPNSPQTRTDLVYLRVWDNAVDASGLYKADVVYLQGTATSGTPTLPTPAGTQIYIPLAQINVPSSGGTASVTDLRPIVVAPGGIIPSSTASGVYVGQVRYNPSTGALEIWNGSAWMPYAERRFIKKTSAGSGSTNSTTYAADNQLTIPLAAGATYTFKGYLLYTTPAAAGLNLRISYSGSASSSSWTPGAISGTNGTDNFILPVRADAANVGTGVSLPGGHGSSALVAQPAGIINTSTAGNLFVEFSQNVANATTTFLAINSWLQTDRVG